MSSNPNWLAQFHEQLGEINFAKNDANRLADEVYFMFGGTPLQKELMELHERLCDAERKLREIIHGKIDDSLKEAKTVNAALKKEVQDASNAE